MILDQATPFYADYQKKKGNKQNLSALWKHKRKCSTGREINH